MINVLLADDDLDDAEIFEVSLRKACSDIAFSRSEDGKQMMEYLKRTTQLPDLIFLDLNMPVMNGWQCLAKIKLDEKLKHIPVIMYTTSSNPRDKEIALDLGAHGLIIKPDRAKLLEQILRRIVCKDDDIDLRDAIQDAYLLSRDH